MQRLELIIQIFKMTIIEHNIIGQSALLFGAVMAHFLQRHVEINHFVETVLKNLRGDELMRWRPLCGSRPIL